MDNDGITAGGPVEGQQSSESIADRNPDVENELLTFYSSCLPSKTLKLPDHSEESDAQEERGPEQGPGPSEQDSQLSLARNAAHHKSRRSYLCPMTQRRKKRSRSRSINSPEVSGVGQDSPGELVDRRSPSDFIMAPHRVTGISSNTLLTPLTNTGEVSLIHRRTLSWSSMTSHDLSRLDGVDFRTIISEQGMSDGEGDTVHRARSINRRFQLDPQPPSRANLGGPWNAISQNSITARVCSFVGSSTTFIHPVSVYLAIIFGSALIHYMLDDPDTIRNRILAVRRGFEKYHSYLVRRDPDTIRDHLLRSLLDLKGTFSSQSNDTWNTLEAAFECRVHQEQADPVIVYLLGFVQTESAIKCLAERIGYALKDAFGDKMVHWLDLSQVKDEQMNDVKKLMRAVFLDLATPHGDVVIVSGIQYICSETISFIFDLVAPRPNRDSSQLFLIITGSLEEDSFPYCFEKKSAYVTEDLERLFQFHLDIPDLTLFNARVIYVLEEDKDSIFDKCGSKFWKSLYKILNNLSNMNVG